MRQNCSRFNQNICPKVEAIQGHTCFKEKTNKEKELNPMDVKDGEKVIVCNKRNFGDYDYQDILKATGLFYNNQIIVKSSGDRFFSFKYWKRKPIEVPPKGTIVEVSDNNQDWGVKYSCGKMTGPYLVAVTNKREIDFDTLNLLSRYKYWRIPK